MTTADEAMRWSRIFKIRELITDVLRELNAEPTTMSRDSERAILWLAAEVAGVASDSVSDENRVALRQLHDELYADFGARDDLMTIGKGDVE